MIILHSCAFPAQLHLISACLRQMAWQDGFNKDPTRPGALFPSQLALLANPAMIRILDLGKRDFACSTAGYLSFGSIEKILCFL
jgi:hypothetical protein